MKLSNVYVSVELDEFKPTLSQIQKYINPHDLVTDINFCKGGLETNPHATLIYSTFENAEYDVEKIGTSFLEKQKVLLRSTLINLSKVSMFNTHDDYDVVKFDVDSDECRQMNTLLKSQFGLQATFPTYQAHVTIAYVKKGMGKKYVDMFNKIIDGDFKPNILKCVVREQNIDGEISTKKKLFNI